MVPFLLGVDLWRGLGSAAGGAVAAVRFASRSGEPLSGGLAAQGGDNKGVCVAALLVQGLQVGDRGRGGHSGAAFLVANGRSVAQGAAGDSGWQGGEGRGGAGEGGGEGRGAGVQGKKVKGTWRDGERVEPASSLSISLSSFTRPGGSTPHLGGGGGEKERKENKVQFTFTIAGEEWPHHREQLSKRLQ